VHFLEAEKKKKETPIPVPRKEKNPSSYCKPRKGRLKKGPTINCTPKPKETPFRETGKGKRWVTEHF